MRLDRASDSPPNPKTPIDKMYMQAPQIQLCHQTIPDLYWVTKLPKKNRAIYATRFLPNGSQVVIKCSKGVWTISK